MRFFRILKIFLFICFLSTSILSCTRQEVHIHDRHSLSYPLIASFGKKHSGTTLVLIDYHHDIGSPDFRILSSNWVGRLLQDTTIDKVLWVSGRDLLLPNRNARIAWLRRTLRHYAPSDAAAIEGRIELADWQSLREQTLPGPVAVTVDFDSFSHDPGDPPERFVDEIARWIARERPELLTLSLSAAYQKNPEIAWDCLERFIDVYSVLSPGSSWHLESGPYGQKAEGTEELTAWRTWENQRGIFGRRNMSFLPGASIWIAPPLALRERLLSLSMTAGDEASADILKGWADGGAREMEVTYPSSATDEALAAAAVSLEAGWFGALQSLPKTGSGNFGLVVRIQSNGGDRGCFAVYQGLSDLPSSAAYCARLAGKDPRYPEVQASEESTIDLEVSIFGPWEIMKNPEDFLPGLDSVLLKRGNETTLLQAPVAAERGYDRAVFLSRLSNKAGLGLDGWKKPGSTFYRAKTVWSRRSLSDIKSSSAYQKYEKK